MTSRVFEVAEKLINKKESRIMIFTQAPLLSLCPSFSKEAEELP
jgi:hypothetical protein